MPLEPANKRTYVFIDGQNLFHAARIAFSYGFPNYDPVLLSQTVCNLRGWELQSIHFYTGIPDTQDNQFWNSFWTAKLAVMGTRGINTFSRSLRYNNKTFKLPTGGTTTQRIGQEKGIDIRIALDVVRLAREQNYDVAVIFSQDQDLSEMVDEVKYIAAQQDRWIKLACAFPCSNVYANRRGIEKTDWIMLDRATYDRCLDATDYRRIGRVSSRPTGIIK